MVKKHNLEQLQEVFKLEKCYKQIPSELYSCLIEQKPTNLVEAALLADQHVAIHKGKSNFKKEKLCTNNKSCNQNSNIREKDNTSNNSNKSATIISNSSSYNKHDNASSLHTSKVYCTYCRRPGHVRDKCYKLSPELAPNKSRNNGTSSVQSVSVSNNDSIKSKNNNDAKTHFEILCNPYYGKYS